MLVLDRHAGSPSRCAAPQRRPSPDLESLSVKDALLSASDTDDMFVEELLFQSGYLTLRDVEKRSGRIRYWLGYLNQEVRVDLNGRLPNVPLQPLEIYSAGLAKPDVECLFRILVAPTVIES